MSSPCRNKPGSGGSGGPICSTERVRFSKSESMVRYGKACSLLDGSLRSHSGVK